MSEVQSADESKQVQVNWPKFNNRQIIETFLTKMSTQDNRATATPYFYVIHNGYDQILPEGHGGTTKYYVDQFERSFDTEDEIKEHCGEDHVFEELKIREYSSERKFEERHMFLTEEEADRHFKVNRYHYSHDAYVYLKHAWRAPDMEEFFNALFDEFGVKRWG